MRRNPKPSAASAPQKSAASAPQDAGFPARRRGPDRPPAWIPEDVDFHNMPEAVRQAVADIVEPAYRRLVAEAEDPLERSVGITIVHLMWLEILEQHEVMQDYLKTSILNLRQDRCHMIDHHLRTLHAKVKVGYFLSRLRELRGRSETPAELPPPLAVRCDVPATATEADEPKGAGSTAKGVNMGGRM